MNPEYVDYNIKHRLNFTIHQKLQGRRTDNGLYLLELPTNYKPFFIYSEAEHHMVFNIRRQKDGWFMEEIARPIYDYILKEYGEDMVTTEYYGWLPNKYGAQRTRGCSNHRYYTQQNTQLSALNNWVERNLPGFADPYPIGVPSGRETEFLEREVNYGDWD